MTKSGSSTHYRLDEDAYKEWQAELDLLGVADSPLSARKPSVKDLIYLALRTRMTEVLTYSEIHDLIAKKGAVSGGRISTPYLRTAMNALADHLIVSGHDLVIEEEDTGRGGKAFCLRQRQGHTGQIATERRDLVLLLDGPGISSEELGRTLLVQRRFSYDVMYLYPQAVSNYSWYSQVENPDRVGLEARSWELIQSRLVGAKSPIAIASLGVSQSGRGEIELLRSMLDDGHTVHYLALDFSPLLLLGHVITVQEYFRAHLDSGQLVFAAVRGELSHLPNALSRARAEFDRRGFVARKTADRSERGFFPSAYSKVVTSFVNCIGNEEPGRETEFLASIRRAFPKERSLAIFLGISVKVKNTIEKYPYEWFDFLVQTPRFLFEERRLLTSLDNEGRELDPPSNEDKEFVLEEPPKKRPSNWQAKNCEVESLKNQKNESNSLRYDLYKFWYRLKYRLTDREHRSVVIASEQKIRLYSIMKYDLNSFRGFLEESAYKVTEIGMIDVTSRLGEKRRYAVVAATVE